MQAGAESATAMEASREMAMIASETAADNDVAVTVVHGMSHRINLTGPLPTLVVSETLGATLLGEGAHTFLADALDRLAPGARVIPAGGCQYATVVGLRSGRPNPFATASPELLDTERAKLYVHTGLDLGLEALSERVCMLEVNFASKSCRRWGCVRGLQRVPFTPLKAGTAVGVVWDWDIWADAEHSLVLSSAADQRNYAGNAAWGHLLQPLLTAEARLVELDPAKGEVDLVAEFHGTYTKDGVAPDFGPTDFYASVVAKGAEPVPQSPALRDVPIGALWEATNFLLGMGA